MATFLDLGAMNVLEYFFPAFIFILVFVLLYATLDKTGLIGKNKSLNITVSLIVALTVLFSGSAVELINFVTPWFAVIIVISLLAILVLSAHLKEGAELKFSLVHILAMIFAGIVLIVGITQVFGPVFTPFVEGADPDWWALRTIFHPRVLGAVFILLVAGFAIKYLAAVKK